MPEIIDKGDAKKLIERLNRFEEIKPILTGPIGKISAIDNDITDLVDFVNLRWSKWLSKNSGKYDLIINAGHFNSVKKFKADCRYLLTEVNDCNAIGIDPGRKIILKPHNKTFEKIINEFKSDEYRIVDISRFQGKTWKKRNITYRRIAAAQKGEYLLLNGNIIGKVTSEDVILKERDGRLIEADGVKLREKDLQKIDEINLKKSKIVTKREINRKDFKANKLDISQDKGVLFVEHNAIKTFEVLEDYDSISGAVLVGDDTTILGGTIFSRLSIPIIGIRDNDPDNFFKNESYHNGSTILFTREDDEFGKHIFKKIFEGKKYIKRNFYEVKRDIIATSRKKENFKKLKIF
ncbi:MAG: hypothetical protein BTN85_0908 [Candidatus Methanohalarchaeum thermophilum]|uniref:DUF2117 domain-containing protein n=1 Tax=Methanohalarchaeum thermophilum TaxID=1903181 RepID=A0A1Q6DVP8_METT1|nr:MAG: hypothetical protein BTN85_0908 [Candidatus Methanohalarchaeum thermophilum]